MTAPENGLDLAEFLGGDYELKVRCLEGHLQRMWMRFNFFLTLQSGLAAGLVLIRTKDGADAATPYLVAAEVALGFVWWIFGSQDRSRVVEYRKSIDETALQLRKRLTGLPADYRFASVVSGGSSLRSPVEWRWRPISITRLPAIVPLVMTPFWLAMMLVD